ncbi:MAG: ribonuclease III [bacterium]
MPSVEDIIGYRFRNRELLKEALTHKSYASERNIPIHNERLEFLGDSILGMVVAYNVFALNPDNNEGHLSKLKSYLASKPVLAKWSNDLDLGSHLYLGMGEETSGGRHRQSIVANAIEALIGAIYLDGGFQKAFDFISNWLAKQSPIITETDYKSRLQELLQKKHKVPPKYELMHSVGPDHDKTFTVTVRLGKKILGHGSGKNKKEAQQAAAKDALSRLGQCSV